MDWLLIMVETVIDIVRKLSRTYSQRLTTAETTFMCSSSQHTQISSVIQVSLASPYCCAWVGKVDGEG